MKPPDVRTGKPPKPAKPAKGVAGSPASTRRKPASARSIRPAPRPDVTQAVPAASRSGSPDGRTGTRTRSRTGSRTGGRTGSRTGSHPLQGPKEIVFLDFDNTLISGDAGPLFGWYLFLWRRHELEGHPFKRFRLWMRYVPFVSWMGLQAVFYKLGAVRRSTIVRGAYKGLKGVDAERFLGLMQQFAHEAIVPRIFPTMRDEVRRHHAEGRRCVVLTTGIEPLVRHVLDHVDPGMELIGCRMRTKKGRLTGKVDGPLYGVDKANILHAYARALGIEAPDCWAYSDHLSDRQMLEAVGHPVAVNPRGRFLRLATRRGWTTLTPQLEVASPP